MPRVMMQRLRKPENTPNQALGEPLGRERQMAAPVDGGAPAPLPGPLQSPQSTLPVTSQPRVPRAQDTGATALEGRGSV